MKQTTLAIMLGIFVISSQAGAAGIKKCKDADGMWHYGDRAADACARSRIIEMDTSGNKTGVVAAPPTEAELKAREARKAEEEARKKAEAEQARKDALLLSIYGHENDIIYVRKRKIAQVEHSIKANQETLETLKKTVERQKKQKADDKSIEHTKSQIKRVEEAIKSKRKEQKEIQAHYEKELIRYREIKASHAAAEQGK